MIRFIFLFLYVCAVNSQVLSAEANSYQFSMDFDKIKDIKELNTLSNVKVYQSSKAICASISDKFPDCGKVLEFNKKAGNALGCDIRFNIPPSVKVTAEIKLYLVKGAKAYFQSGLLAFRSEKKICYDKHSPRTWCASALFAHRKEDGCYRQASYGQMD